MYRDMLLFSCKETDRRFSFQSSKIYPINTHVSNSDKSENYNTYLHLFIANIFLLLACKKSDLQATLTGTIVFSS